MNKVLVFNGVHELRLSFKNER